MALYPPIIASSMPAFDVRSGKVRIYYTLSTYNIARIDDIQAVHVTVRRQSSNVNVLREPGQILSKPFPGDRDDIDKALNRYYIEINNSDLLEDEPFQVDALYKVQLRFSSNTNTANLFTNDVNNFSEWSTVCIIKPIQIPEFYIDDFYTGQPPKETDQNNFYSILADFVGVYNQKGSSQALKHWRLRLLMQDYTQEKILEIDDYTLADSGFVLNQAQNYNLNTGLVVFSCSLPYEFTNGESYKLLFEIQTKNGYENSLLYNFTCSQTSINPLQGTLTTYINEEEGYIKLNFTSDEINMGNLVIRRTDSKSNFLKWEDLKFFETHTQEDYNFNYYDFTAESGLFYRYLVQKVDARGRRGTPVYDSSRNALTGVMGEWEHAFLLETTGNGNLSGTKQLKLKYDFQISSYKTNVSESKTDTIGSKYPFIRRNGTMYYRSFPITGTITQFMDEADLFTNSETLFDNHYEKYTEFKGQIGNYVNQYDYTYERKFREKVEEFLYNAKPKLYKSMQEGNIFIKLMQVSLTPKNELGRLVYNFSATAYEIDEAKISTFDNYRLIDVGTFNPNVSSQTEVMGQLTSFDSNDNIFGSMFKAGQDIVGAGQARAATNSIAKKIKFNIPFNNKIISDFTINWLRLTIESNPYLIIEQSPGVFRPYDDISKTAADQEVEKYIPYNSIDKEGPDPVDFTQPINYQLYQIESTYNGMNVYLGWLFNINGQSVIISPPNNIYELKENTFSFGRNTPIIPAKDTAMLVDYRLIQVKQEDLSNLPKNIRINKVNGQLMGTYSINTELISRINYKYRYTYESGTDKIERKVNGVETISIDTEPGAIVYIKTSTMTTEQRFVVNHTGEFTFDPMDTQTTITSLKIAGMNINLAYYNDRGTVSNLEEVNFPKNGDYCKIRDEYYYYNTTWYQGTLVKQGAYNTVDQKGNPIQRQEKSLDIQCPVDALVFYYAAIREDYY